ncbi:hypothetical protein MNEG_13655 [Monoraphidium neglectum]|uniref:Uncharacterized protein n=1 Tax=Monoraphidium neglectum TaxID=145388 RepID=A0A0D2LXS4_9CHLO|nr:hypothetical protein MNEG_13655 [Monoraphidium neglectum]KIY94306.1 hypothetical protein MNEG_13655 [Monoraphidium neglectum]|eukprot:XP_013893326.1 hypothetical protein MNEG_13655 [Monoraphidium neglectum]
MPGAQPGGAQAASIMGGHPYAIQGGRHIGAPAIIPAGGAAADAAAHGAVGARRAGPGPVGGTRGAGAGARQLGGGARAVPVLRSLAATPPVQSDDDSGDAPPGATAAAGAARRGAKRNNQGGSEEGDG